MNAIAIMLPIGLMLSSQNSFAKKGSFGFAPQTPPQVQQRAVPPPSEDYSAMSCPELQLEIKRLEKEESRILGDPQILAIRRQMTAGGIDSLQQELYLKRKTFESKSCQNTEKQVGTSAKTAGHIVFTGTFSWRFGSDRVSVVSSLGDDISFQIRGKATLRSSLQPLGQTRIYLSPPTKPPLPDLRRIRIEAKSFSSQPIAVEVLTPGSIIIVRTKEGRLGALRVLRFYDSNDLAFEGTGYLPESARHYLAQSRSIPRYHIEMEWAFL